MSQFVDLGGQTKRRSRRWQRRSRRSGGERIPMFEWFFAPYSRLLWGAESLLVIPGLCGAPVDVARAVTLLLCAAAVARIGAHCVADQRLRRRSPVYGPDRVLRAVRPLSRGRNAGGAHAPAAAAPARGPGPAGIHHGVLLARRLPGTRGDPLARNGRAARRAGARAVDVRQRDNLRAWLGSLLSITALAVLMQAAVLAVMVFRMEMPFGFAHAGMLAAAVVALALDLPVRRLAPGWSFGASSPATTGWWRRCRTRWWSPRRW